VPAKLPEILARAEAGRIIDAARHLAIAAFMQRVAQVTSLVTPIARSGIFMLQRRLRQIVFAQHKPVNIKPARRHERTSSRH
jgi:hypothetical protein